ncbi:iron-sulfur cluster assembly scaffold protein [Turicimonas muris]|uniref:iron-sulfur cluster assembly scaffold protein n=1 Tax=Turicimonas muris TaxID=1796652 RepID=UPI0024B9E9F8|nr:iron-sulfur cluster assembly scaffold protein [Turicimonas muris]
MFSERILKRFTDPKYAGGLRGANGTGKSGESSSGDLIKIYILVNDENVITDAKFKAYGGVCTIAACDVACGLIEGRSLEAALRTNYYQILEEMGQVPSNREYTAALAEEAIKNAIEDFYKKKEKEIKSKK